MGEFDDAHAFVDGFFAALASRAPQSDSWAQNLSSGVDYGIV